MKTIRLQDTGLSIRLRIKDSEGAVVDLSTASTKRIDFRRPDRTEFSKTASLYTDGMDGIMFVNTSAGEINQEGIWEIQGYVVLGAGNFSSNIVRFRVTEIIND